MSKNLRALSAHIIDNKLCRTEQIDSWVDSARLRNEARNHGQFTQMFLVHSRCTMIIEGYAGDSRLLMAHICAWLQDHDDVNERESYGLPDPDITVEMLDKSGRSHDVDISVEFLEPVFVIPDTDGDIEWQGRRWSIIDEPVVDVAEDGVVDVAEDGVVV